MPFTWDESKAASNEKQHGVSFEEARTVFLDETRLCSATIPTTPRRKTGFPLVGWSQRRRVLVVVHCYRASDEIIRLISAREGTRAERRAHIAVRS